MKVLYFHQHFSTPAGGTGTRSYEFSKVLIEESHDVVMVCGSFDVGNTGLTKEFVQGKREGIVDGIHVIEFELPYSNKQSFLKRTLQFLRFSLYCCLEVIKNKPDLVFCTSTPLTISLPGIFSKVFLRKKFVLEIRDLWPELPQAMGVIKNPLILWLMKLLEVVSYKSADHVIALSKGMQNGITKYIPEAKTEVISNGCDFIHYSETRNNVEFPEGIGADDFVAVYSGTHGLANGLDAVIEVAKELKLQGDTDIKLLLIGDGKEKSRLVATANELSLDNIVFMDSLPKKQLFSLLRRCGVGLMILDDIPAFYNGTSPNKFFDYISLGLPVICNYPGWVAGLVTDKRLGISVEPASPKQFVNALLEMKQNPNELEVMSGNANSVAREMFDRRNLAQKFVSSLEKVVKD